MLGATLQPEDDLAQHLRDYCASMTDAVRAEKFIQAQLGSADHRRPGRFVRGF